MAPVYLVRHAKAGQRQKWDGPDSLRPLSKKGTKQARGLVDVLADRDVIRVLSSPFVRCVQTVEPLAERLGVPVEPSDALAEGADTQEVVALVRGLKDGTAVLCSHGDVIPNLLDALVASDGLRLPDDYPCAKGSTWVLRPDGDGRFTEAEYLDAP